MVFSIRTKKNGSQEGVMFPFEEKGWMLFCNKLPKWKKAYMERLIKEYAERLYGYSQAYGQIYS